MSHMRGGARGGSTLLEMLIVLTLMALIASVATLAVRVVERSRPHDPAVTLADSSSAAIRDGRAITLADTIDGRPVAATVRPDGSVAADSAFHANPLGGRTTHAP